MRDRPCREYITRRICDRPEASRQVGKGDPAGLILESQEIAGGRAFGVSIVWQVQ